VGEELLINTMLKTKLIKRGILELGPIVTTNGHQAVGMLIVQPQSQALKVLKNFILAVTPGFKAKPNAHSMYAQESNLRTYRSENGYRITNVSI
jgi:hypothetical protein